MSRTIHTIATALALLAIAAPAATAMPSDGPGDASPATTAKPSEDVRTADARDGGVPTASSPSASSQPDPRAAVGATEVDGGGSPLVYVLPALVAGLLLAAIAGHAVRVSGRSSRAHIGA